MLLGFLSFLFYSYLIIDVCCYRSVSTFKQRSMNLFKPAQASLLSLHADSRSTQVKWVIICQYNLNFRNNSVQHIKVRKDEDGFYKICVDKNFKSVKVRGIITWKGASRNEASFSFVCRQATLLNIQNFHDTCNNKKKIVKYIDWLKCI